MRVSQAILITSLAIAPVSAAIAGGVLPSGVIVGSFSDPVYTGLVANSPSLGSTQFFDNSTTAPPFTFIVNNAPPNGSQIRWGANTGGGVGTFSQLTFFGATIPSGIDIYTTPFLAGTLTYFNGTSALDSLVFGASLSFQAGGVLLGTDNVIITTTSNIAADVANPLNADYINICGNSSNICGKSIETNEGYAATFNLYATVVGDPMLGFTRVELKLGNDLAAGQIGNQPAIGAVPEPSTWAMLLLGFAGVGVMACRRRKAMPRAARSC